jgi:hypothetical protein
MMPHLTHEQFMLVFCTIFFLGLFLGSEVNRMMETEKYKKAASLWYLVAYGVSMVACFWVFRPDCIM